MKKITEPMEFSDPSEQKEVDLSKGPLPEQAASYPLASQEYSDSSVEQEKTLVDPFIPITDGDSVMPLDWVSEQAAVESENKCEIDLTKGSLPEQTASYPPASQEQLDASVEQEKTLVDPFIPITDGDHVTLFGCISEQAALEGENKCGVNLSTSSFSDQTEIYPPTSQELWQRYPIPHPPKPCSNQPLGYTGPMSQSGPTCEVESKPSPYSTAQKLMKLVSLLTVDSCLYVYNGKYYQKLALADAQRLIVEMCRKDVEMAGTPNHPRAVYDLLLMEPKLFRQKLVNDPQALAFDNGVLMLDTRRFQPHTPALFTTYYVPCQYLFGIPTSPPCPRFEQFLFQITGGDLALIKRIWQMVGYVITPDTRGKVFFLLQGVSNSGKSVLSALLGSLFNEEAVISLDVHALSERFAVSELQGKALCLSPDLPSGPLDNKAVSKLKQLTGNDEVSADKKFKDRVHFSCSAKIVLASNHPLLIREQDDAFTQRAVVIPFNYSIPKELQDPHLLDVLMSERAEIATKAIDEYFHLVEQNYRFAGNYPLNTAVSLYSQNQADITTCICDFLQTRFVRDEDCGVFTCDMFHLFEQKYGPVPLQLFSSQFAALAQQLYGAKKIRKRKVGETNPLSYFAGIRYIGGDFKFAP